MQQHLGSLPVGPQPGLGPAAGAMLGATGTAGGPSQASTAQRGGLTATTGLLPAPTKPKSRRRVLSSLTLQVFIFFGGWWDVFYYVLNILVFVYKGVNLPYLQRNFAMEFSFSWLWVLIEIPRLFLASQGNKTEHAGPLVFSFVLGAPLLAMYVYFISFQTYVLKIDELLNGGALFFLGVQVVLGLFTCFRFVMATRFTSA